MKKILISIVMGFIMLMACASTTANMTPEQQKRKATDMQALEDVLGDSYSQEKTEAIKSMISEMYDLFMRNHLSVYGNNDKTKEIFDEANQITVDYFEGSMIELKLQVHERSCEKRIMFTIVFQDGSYLVTIFWLNQMQEIEAVCEDTPSISL